MRIPISNSTKGVIKPCSFDKNDAWFIPVNDFSYESYVKKGMRVASYGEFRELYPFRNRNARHRSLKRTKENAEYNKKGGFNN